MQSFFCLCFFLAAVLLQVKASREPLPHLRAHTAASKEARPTDVELAPAEVLYLPGGPDATFRGGAWPGAGAGGPDATFGPGGGAYGPGSMTRAPDAWREWHNLYKVGGISGVVSKIMEGMLTFDVQTLACALVTVLLLSLVAFLYQRYKVDLNRALAAKDDFKHELELIDGRWRFGLLDCCSDARTTCLVCWCPAIRWADTIRMTGMLGFWTAFAIFMVLGVFSELTFGIAHIALLILLIVYRQRMRVLFKLGHGSCGTYIEDFLTYLCCGCCAIVQEARQLEEAYAVGHPVATAPRAAAPMQ